MIDETLAFDGELNPCFILIFFYYFLTCKFYNISLSSLILCFYSFRIVVKVVSAHEFFAALIYFIENRASIILLFRFLLYWLFACGIMFLLFDKVVFGTQVMILSRFHHLTGIKPSHHSFNSMHFYFWFL